MNGSKSSPDYGKDPKKMADEQDLGDRHSGALRIKGNPVSEEPQKTSRGSSSDGSEAPPLKRTEGGVQDQMERDAPTSFLPAAVLQEPQAVIGFGGSQIGNVLDNAGQNRVQVSGTRGTDGPGMAGGLFTEQAEDPYQTPAGYGLGAHVLFFWYRQPPT